MEETVVKYVRMEKGTVTLYLDGFVGENSKDEYWIHERDVNKICEKMENDNN